MWRWLGARAAVITALGLCAQSAALGTPPTAQAAVLAQGGAFCAPGQPPRFLFGIADLQARLGAPMGDPTECEHVDAVSGDTIQRTSTGLAYFRPSLNLAMFTNGEAHWTVANSQLLMWKSGSATPPEATAAEWEYLNRTEPIRGRYAELQSRLDAARQRAGAGQLDRVDVAALTQLVDELRATRDAYAASRVTGRLSKHHGLMVTSVNAAMGSAEMLSQARQIDAPEARNGFLDKATMHREESEKLLAAAIDAFSRALPIVVN